MDDLRIIRSYFLETPPTPHKIMASNLVQINKVYRQWDTNGNLLLWINSNSIYELKPDSGPNRFIQLDEDEILISIPVEFT